MFNISPTLVLTSSLMKSFTLSNTCASACAITDGNIPNLGINMAQGFA